LPPHPLYLNFTLMKVAKDQQGGVDRRALGCKRPRVSMGRPAILPPEKLEQLPGLKARIIRKAELYRRCWENRRS
jgi:hypothetical protein